MKIIHCADIHLDSAFSANFTAKQAVERRNELLKTFVNMVEYADDNGVSVIIIAGDWFDTANVSVNTRDVVAGCIRKFKNIDFVYLVGNHDEDIYLRELGKFDNLKIFGRDGDSFHYGKVVISKNVSDCDRVSIEKLSQQPWSLDESDINIVVAHGEIADVKSYAGKNIDYLALGHIHKHIEGVIDARGVYCYCGCLEARGFDECGEQGFVELEIGEAGISHRFVPFGYRHARSIQVEVTYDSGENGMDTIILCDRIEEKLADVSKKDMVKVRLTGCLAPGDSININYIQNYFKDRFFAFRIEDATALVLDVDVISREKSLRGAFIREVMASDEPEDVKRSIIKCGLSALAGEVIEE